jgi:NodT family efflux transporter outer membrane factor (OMF) lipoprotein
MNPFIRFNRSQCAAALLTTSLFFGGCMVGPDYATPDTDVPDSWGNAFSVKTDSATVQLAEWWKQFNDPILNDLIERAYSGNLSLKEAVTRIDIARGAVDVSESELYPQVSGTGSVTDYEYSKETNAAGPHREGKLYDVGLSAGWELDLWGRVRRSVEASDASYEASLEDYNYTLVILYSEIAQSYINVRSAQKRLQLTQANLKRQQETLELTKNRFDAGLAPELDVKQAELNASTTESFLPLLEIALAENLHRLGVLVGAYPDALLSSLEVKQPIPQAMDSVATGIPADLLRQRPDIRAAELRLAEQTALIGVATAELYPTLTLPGTLSLQAFNSGDLGNGRGYGIGPAFSWNLFSGGRVRAQIYQQEKSAEAAELQYQQTVLDALEEVQNSLVTQAQQRKRVESLQRSVSAASDSVDLVMTLYKTGLTDFQNVLDMERSLAAQQDSLAETEGNLSNAQVSLYRAMGGGWQTVTNP